MSKPTSKLDDAPVPNNSVAAADFKRLQSHNEIVLKELQKAPRTNDEILRVLHAAGKRIPNLTGRISDVRVALRKRGLTILALNLSGGLWLYKIGANINNQTRMKIAVGSFEDDYVWQCPRCNFRVKRAKKDSNKTEIQSMPLCSLCVADLKLASRKIT